MRGQAASIRKSPSSMRSPVVLPGGRAGLPEDGAREDLQLRPRPRARQRALHLAGVLPEAGWLPEEDLDAVLCDLHGRSPGVPRSGHDPVVPWGGQGDSGAEAGAALLAQVEEEDQLVEGQGEAPTGEGLGRHPG
jgi:hypothetical protein